MHKYRYIGEHEVELSGYGLVQKGETIETNLEINHPEFILEGQEPKEEKKEVQTIQHHQEEQQEEITEDN